MEIVEKYFPDLSTLQKKKFFQLKELYTDWNQKINVISRKDIDQLYLRHVLHSMAIAKYIQFAPNTRIIDLGTGGGFPGIPLAVMFPDSNFLLVDSVKKKTKVVESICQTLQLENCRVMCIRAEEVREQFDFVVCRAVATLNQLIEWTKHIVSNSSKNYLPNGILALKGGDLFNELDINYKYIVINLNNYYEETFFETKKLVHIRV